MASLNDLLINNEALERLSDQETLLQCLDEGKTIQEIFGFTNDALLEFYEAAQNILEQKRFDDAIKAFTFLTTLNPNLSDFWKGLGMAQQNNNNYESAIFSYSMGYQLEAGEITSYMLAAQCFMEINDFDQAMEVLEFALDYAKKHPEDLKSQQLEQDALAAKKYVKSKQH